MIFRAPSSLVERQARLFERLHFCFGRAHTGTQESHHAGPLGRLPRAANLLRSDHPRAQRSLDQPTIEPVRQLSAPVLPESSGALDRAPFSCPSLRAPMMPIDKMNAMDIEGYGSSAGSLPPTPSFAPSRAPGMGGAIDEDDDSSFLLSTSAPGEGGSRNSRCATDHCPSLCTLHRTCLHAHMLCGGTCARGPGWS